MTRLKHSQALPLCSYDNSEEREQDPNQDSVVNMQHHNTQERYNPDQL